MTISAPVFTWVAIVGFVALFAAAAWLMSREAGIIYGVIDDIETRAKKAITEDELRILQMELIAWAQKRCWHRHHMTRAREVHAYITGRRDALR